MSNRNYGLPPQDWTVLDLSYEWTEYMHYLYLPVVMPEQAGLRLPPNLRFLEHILTMICRDNAEAIPFESGDHDRYVYVTARRGYASPGNPLNCPGWHADGFGSDDVNYIWSDRWPTRFAVGEFVDVSKDHIRSAEQFEEQIETACDMVPEEEYVPIRVQSGKANVVYRLTPDVIHATPIIDPPGGDRSFWKVSVSPNRYNLVGNSHNHLFDYDWEMYTRSEVRNDPIKGGGDAGPQT